MKELQAIVEAFEQITKNSGKAALATVIQVRGSTYRRPGARMLIAQDGRTVGTVSGGCLEADVFDRAQKVMLSGEPVVVTYDTTTEADIVWGLGLGCNGVVKVLIELLPEDDEMSQTSHVAFLKECMARQHPGALATVFHVEGEVRAKAGKRLMLHENGAVICDIEDPELATKIVNDAWQTLGDGRSRTPTYDLLLGNAEVFIEVIQPPVPLLLFGAGHDAVPVANFARALGWHVTVIDTLARPKTRDRFAEVDAVLLCRPIEVRDRIHLNSRTVAVVMSHNYLHDLELLRTLLPSAVRYIGVLGPKSRTERLLRELQQEGSSFTEKQLGRLHGPVGLDIGADTPEEIALSIVAEIRASLAGRVGGMLRERQESIHV